MAIFNSYVKLPEGIVEDPIPMELGLPPGNLHGRNWFMNVYNAKLDLDWIKSKILRW
jgi:hypothetical protein